MEREERGGRERGGEGEEIGRGGRREEWEREGGNELCNKVWCINAYNMY